MRDEWVAKFIMGSADLTDDAQWNSYIQNLNTAGLEEALEINAETAIISE